MKCAGNQCGKVENQGLNLGITVEMRKEKNGNDKFKEWREVIYIWGGNSLLNHGNISMFNRALIWTTGFNTVSSITQLFGETKKYQITNFALQ